MKKIFTLAALAALTLSANAGVKVLLPIEESNEAKWVKGADIWGDADVAVYNSESQTGLTYTYYTDETKKTKSGTDGKGKEVTPYYTTTENQVHWVADNSMPEGFTIGGQAATKAYVQGSTNGMYYAIAPAKAGTLSFGFKMGKNKNTYILKTTTAKIADITTEASASSLISNDLLLCSDVKGTVECEAPTVTYNVKGGSTGSGSFDGTTAINTSGSDQWIEVTGVEVSEGDVVIVGCDGSKVMFKGVALSGASVADGVVYTSTNPSAVQGVAEAKSEKAAPVKVLGANGILIGNYTIAGQQVK